MPNYRSRSHPHHPHPHTEKALGIANGVGGWAKYSSHSYPTPNALFTRRLMHFYSEEIADTLSLPTAQFSFGHHSKLPLPSINAKSQLDNSSLHPTVFPPFV